MLGERGLVDRDISDQTNHFHLGKETIQIQTTGQDKVVKYEAQRVEELCGAKLAMCGCPVRPKPPPLPEKMPFKEREVDKLQQWMLDRYAASAFNVCTHQKLNKMSGPPLKLLVDPMVEPAARCPGFMAFQGESQVWVGGGL